MIAKCTQIVLIRHRKSPEFLDLQGVPGLNLLLPLAEGLLIRNKFVQKIYFLLSGRFALSEGYGLSDMRCRGVTTGQLQYSGWVISGYAEEKLRPICSCRRGIRQDGRYSGNDTPVLTCLR